MPDLPAPTPRPRPASGPRPRPASLAAALMWAQVLVIVGFSVFYVIELAQGMGDDRVRVSMSIVVFLVGAVGLAALARGLSAGASWARTPTVTWNALLVPLAVSLAQAGQPLLGVAVGIVAVGAIVAVVLSGRR